MLSMVYLFQFTILFLRDYHQIIWIAILWMKRKIFYIKILVEFKIWIYRSKIFLNKVSCDKTNKVCYKTNKACSKTNKIFPHKMTKITISQIKITISQTISNNKLLIQIPTCNSLFNSTRIRGYYINY